MRMFAYTYKHLLAPFLKEVKSLPKSIFAKG